MEIENLLQNHSAQYQCCLFKAGISIVEYEFEGEFHSNRKKNAILNICQKHPTVLPFFQHVKHDKGEDHIDEELSISNFSKTDYLQKGMIDDSIIRAIVTKIPRPYGINHLELIFDDVRFGTKPRNNGHIKPPECGFGLPCGNYVRYERYIYGSEKHSYIYFSADDQMHDDMRHLFFEFAARIPGKYESTEIQNKNTI